MLLKNRKKEFRKRRQPKIKISRIKFNVTNSDKVYYYMWLVELENTNKCPIPTNNVRGQRVN